MVAWLHCFGAHGSTVHHGRIRGQKELLTRAWERRKSRDSTTSWCCHPGGQSYFTRTFGGYLRSKQPLQTLNRELKMLGRKFIQHSSSLTVQLGKTCCVEWAGPPWDACSLPYSSIWEDGQLHLTSSGNDENSSLQCVLHWQVAECMSLAEPS